MSTHQSSTKQSDVAQRKVQSPSSTQKSTGPESGGRVTQAGVSGASPAHGLGAETLLSMQRQAGNDAVSQMVDGPVQRKADGGPAPTAAPAPARASSAGADSRSLPASVRAKMESSFGVDFSDVRVHEGNQAAQAGALAYAQGSNLYFAPGLYDPHSAVGQHMLGHELAHVVQQRAGRVAKAQGFGGLPINADPGLESEADHMGSRAARGDRASVPGAERATHANASGGEAPVQRIAPLLLGLLPMLMPMIMPMLQGAMQGGGM